MSERTLDQVRKLVLALPEVNERLSHGAVCFFVRNRRPVCYYHDDHTGDGRISLWCPAPPGLQEELVSADPERFFAPTPSASGTFSSWVAVYLDGSGEHHVDWDEVAELLVDAFRMVAPTSLVAELDR